MMRGLPIGGGSGDFDVVAAHFVREFARTWPQGGGVGEESDGLHVHVKSPTTAGADKALCSDAFV